MSTEGEVCKTRRK